MKVVLKGLQRLRASRAWSPPSKPKGSTNAPRSNVPRANSASPATKPTAASPPSARCRNAATTRALISRAGAEQPVQPQVRQLLLHGVGAQARVEVREVHPVERLILVEAGEDEGLHARLGVNVLAEALRADLLHHALHRAVDGADADVTGL